MATPLLQNKIFAACFIIILFALIITIKLHSLEVFCSNTCQKLCKSTGKEEGLLWEQELHFAGFNNETGTIDGRYIVPNYLHFIRFGQSKFNFVHAVCVLAAYKNQKPERIFFHTDQVSFYGKYWNILMNTAGFKKAVVIIKTKIPTEIFGQKLSLLFKYFHGADVARLQVMMAYGGIYLDSDAYLVKSLNDFRRFEMALGWMPGYEMGNQILVAHKDARFLRHWYDSYRNNYNNQSWYYNAGSYPAFQILTYRPQLVHRVEKLFGNYQVKWSIFMTNFSEWRDYYSLHLQSRPHVKFGPEYSVVFDEVNVLQYPIAFREMCKAVYPFE